MKKNDQNYLLVFGMIILPIFSLWIYHGSLISAIGWYLFILFILGLLIVLAKHPFIFLVAIIGIDGCDAAMIPLITVMSGLY